jgi:hypothetical protein
MPTAATNSTAIVTKNELTELAEWERKHAKAQRDSAAAKKELDFQRIRLAEKVLGVKTADELKRMTPVQVEKLQRKRLAEGDWKPERGAPEFSFVKSSEGRYPSWSQLYAEELGEAAAQQIRANTPVTYSYAVEVSVPA